MAEVKNSFLSSKMNKDLDDRLIPNSEYRDALNIEVGKSETNNIGVLQNVYGNIQITQENIEGLECIGAFMDNENNRIFQFLTNYSDPFPNEITPCESLNYSPDPDGWVMKIVVQNFGDPVSYVTLVEGTFLNFAKNKQFRINAVNLIEGLLFWTDNRNQPRKINVNLANPNSLAHPTYYTVEHQISVAKYAPVDPITLYRKVTATVTDASAMSPEMRPSRIATGRTTEYLARQSQWDGTTGKLNPRWVETLMGLPVGWTMPSCASPATIAPMNCASLATESSQQQQP